MLLTDHEITDFLKDPAYIAATRVGLKECVADLIANGAGEVQLHGIQRLFSNFFRARIISAELDETTRDLVERLLNRELNWRRDSFSVEELFGARRAGRKWLKYDEAQITAVFARAIHVITDAGVRDAIKRLSTTPTNEQNGLLESVYRDVDSLRQETLYAIHSRAIFDRTIRLRAVDYYQQHKEQIVQEYLRGARGEPPLLNG